MIWHGIAAALASVCLFSTVFGAATGPADEPPEFPDSFSARYEYRHQPSGIVLDAASLLVSPTGVRIDQRLNAASNTLIGNFHEHRFWFIDRQRKISHEIPVKLNMMSDATAMPDAVASFAAFLQFEPCQSVDARPAGLVIWRGRKTQQWYCEHDGELLETHWFDTRFGVVVKSETPDGFVSELTHIRARTVTPDHFQPPASYRAVSVSELMGVARPIKPYEVSNQSQN